MGTQQSPNVLLVVLDSVRAANCSLYGGPRETTPFLSTLARESVTYTQARAPSNWSVPCHVGLFTGLEAHEHRVTVHDRLRPGNTLFEDLAGEGYATGVFTENGFLTEHEVDIGRCFETVVGVPEEHPDRYDTAQVNPGPDGFYYADRLLEWTAGRDSPWAACLNLMDAHRPFEPRPAFDRWGDERARALQRDLDPRWEWTFHGGDRPYWQLAGLERLYDGGIRQADAVLERTLDGLRDRGCLDETLVVVCGDHGDGFGEPGRLPGEPPAVSHIVPMSEELLHVPLVVRPPGGTDGREVDDLATLTRFSDVVRGYVDGDPPERGFATQRAFAMKQPVTADLRERFERHCDDVDRFLAPSRAVYTNLEGRSVAKRYYWGAEGCEQLIRRPRVLERFGDVEPAAVDSAFESGASAASGGTDERGVREPLGGRVRTDDAREQLAALGYY